MTPPTGQRSTSRLSRLDAAADAAATSVVKGVAVVLVVVSVAYLALWVLTVLSFGSRPADYEMGPGISVEPPARCESSEVTRYEQLGGRDFYVTRGGGC